MQNSIHGTLKALSNGKDKAKGLRFGQMLLRLKSICQLINVESIQNIFFNNDSKVDAQFCVDTYLRQVLENSLKSETSADAEPRDQELAHLKTLFASHLPSYLNAYYATMVKRNALFNLKNSFI